MNQYNLNKPLWVRDGDRLKAIYLHEIFFIRSDKNYCRIYALRKDKFFHLRDTMANLEGRMDQDLFCRIHDQYIISYGHIDSIDIQVTSVILKTGEELPVSRTYVERFKKWLRL